jgi:hypothetical protein
MKVQERHSFLLTLLALGDSVKPFGELLAFVGVAVQMAFFDGLAKQTFEAWNINQNVQVLHVVSRITRRLQA